MHQPQQKDTGRQEASGNPYGVISDLLVRTRRRAFSVYAGTSICLILAIVLALGLAASITAGLVLGQATHPPLWPRLVFFALLAAGSVALAWQLFVRPARRLASDRRTAAFLESRASEIAGLATAVELQEEMSAGKAHAAEDGLPYSAELARAHIARLANIAGGLDPRPVVPTLDLRRAAVVASTVAAVHLLAVLGFPGTIGGGYRALMGGAGAIPGISGEISVGVAELITGEVDLVYHYPEYTGLSSRAVSGTGGDIRALKGTEVEIITRADRDVEAAAIVKNDSEISLEVVGSRELRGRLLLSEAGEYRFRFLNSRGRTVAEGPSHTISIEPDEHPHVEVSLPEYPGEDEVEIREQERLALDYRARDDFGLEEISIVWRVRGGSEQRKVIQRGRGRDRLEGRWGWDVSTLGLAAGDRVAWFLEATDNDSISGPKKSTTRTHYLKVFSAAEHHRALIAKVEAHWEAMIDNLADHLESPFDPAKAPSALGGGGDEAAEQSDLEDRLGTARRQAESIEQLTADIADTVADLREDPLSPVALVDTLENVRSGLVTANRRFESALRLLSSRTSISERAERGQVLRVGSTQDRIITELENGILYLETLLDKQRLQDLIAMGEEIREQQRRLAELVESLRDDPDEETRAAISEEIGRIKERIQELMRRMAEMASDIRDDYLNIEAMEQLREQEDLLTSLDQIQQMVEEGDLDEALSRLMDMANQVDSLLEEWRSRDDAFGGEQYAELQREIMEFIDDLQRVKRDQENLLDETEELRERYRDEIEERLRGPIDDLVERLVELALEGKERLERIPDQVMERGFGRIDRDSVELGIIRLDDVSKLLQARDFEEARRMAKNALDQADRAASSFSGQLRYTEQYRQVPGERRDELERAASNAEHARGNAERIVEELDELFPDPSEVFSECEQSKMAEMGEQQRSLQGRSRELGRRMRDIGDQAPLFSPDMEHALQEAGGYMAEAGRHLDSSDARRATGRQRAASDRLQELQDQMEEASRQAGGQGMPMPMAGQPQRRGHGGAGLSSEPVEIPDADQYETPEQFRRELLEAMREGTPERYREQVRRYYEELVR